MGIVLNSVISLENLLVVFIVSAIYPCSSIWYGVSFPWNSSYTVAHWMVYHAQVCGRECHDDKLVVRYGHGYCAYPSCFFCNCDSNCRLLGTCCLKYNQVWDRYYQDVETSVKGNPMQWYRRLRCWNPPNHWRLNIPHGYLTAVRCPPAWNDQAVRDKCENPPMDSLDDVTPLSDKTTRLLFPNVHCAKCHDRQIHNPVGIGNRMDHNGDDGDNSDEPVAYRWELKLKCKHYQELYSATSKFKLYKMAGDTRDCRVEFVSPIHFSWSPMGCRFPLDTGDITPPPPHEDCQWQDPVLERLCHTLDPIASLTVDGYRNLFCSTCNRTEPQKKDCGHVDPSVTEDGMLPPMYLLFTPRTPYLESEPRDRECPSGNWRNDEGICTLANCAPGKILDKGNETCDTAISDIVGLGYNFDFIFVALNHVNGMVVSCMDQYISNQILQLGMDAKFDSLYVFEDPQYYYGPGTLLHRWRKLTIRVKGHIIASLDKLRDEEEASFIASLVQQQQWEFFVDQNGLKQNVSLQMVSVGRKMAGAYPLNDYGFNGNRDSIHSISDNEMFLINPREDHPLCLKEDGTVQTIFLKLDHRDYVDKVKAKMESFIELNPALSCPFVMFNWTDHYMLENGSLVFSFYFRDRLINLTDYSRVSVVGESLLLCLDFVKELTAEYDTGPERQQSYSTLTAIQFNLDVACTVLSVTFLMVSFITYCLFRPLRAIPGLNNMCLCVSLATAQTSLLVTAVYGVTGRLNETYCMVHAVVLHYSWLSSFCWMNTCSIHMFRVFTSTRPVNSWSVRKTHCRYCIYSFGIPLLLVILTLAVTSFITKGDSIGYSSKQCFLDVYTSALITIVALLLPAILSMMVNFILFVLTVREIVIVTRLQQSTRGNQGVMTYIKLSTVTGVFCAVSAAAVLSGNQVLMIVASPLGALLGFFIFMAFIFNKHVATLYKDLILGRPTPGQSSSAKLSNTQSTHMTDLNKTNNASTQTY